MKIQQIRRDKDEYIDMLLMADPQRDMIESYLDNSEMFALINGGDVCAVCVVELLKNRKCELKNIVTRKKDRGKGYAKYMIRHICEHYGNQCDTMYAGTGNCKKTLEFLGKCGFVNSHMVANYYPEHYREPIYEEGVRLTDKIYLKKQLDSEVSVKKVVDLALEAGRILLKNGAEIFRVDETIIRICKRFHVEYVDTFILSHAIFISAENGMEEAYTKVKQVPLSSSHLGIVAEVNELSREIAEGLVSIEEASERLREIDRFPEKRGYFQVLAAGISSGCYGYILGASALESIVAFFIGCILYVWVLTAKKLKLSKMIVNIVGGVMITTLAIAGYHLPLPGEVALSGMIIGSIMPLVPGLAFVNAIRDIADSDFLSGTVRMIDALLVFVYIAVGVGVTLSAYNNMGGGLML
ncbi:threonine/serine exporter family protein [Lachnospiraceae bacterium WCA-9-b2]|uniref:Threonine/serine exporter family protein n=1 Tax=Sporofaciens musculi TaxID=2681861 RepID=A0A7X3MFL6_9FIRM|nr:GNAT family N-acetyltransferase [Sporofaciens musculi]MXP75518.1 threonine/serine exporter family protein [Sporofaciens musculi]